MATIPSGILVAWPSTAASIPSGWTRETQLDGKYIQGAPAAGDADFTARGNATQAHTSPPHKPIQNSHTHSVSAGSASGTVNPSFDIGDDFAAVRTHTHAGAASAATTATNNGVAITVNTTSNDLAYKKVIWIKS